MQEALRTNPSSKIVLNLDRCTQHLKRLFVSFRACISGFKFCRPMLFLDGTFLKGKYNGQLLGVTAKDGNQGEFFQFMF